MKLKKSQYSLQINNLTLKLNKKNVLSNITLSLKEKESAVLIGPSGCGKTTLLRTISGFAKNLQSGTILIDTK